MKSHFKIALLGIIGIGGFAPAHAQIYNNGVFYNSFFIYCDGDFINTSTAQWVNSGTLSITGNIYNDEAAMNPSTGLTNFIGTSNQTINGLQPFICNDVDINNAAGVTLNQILRVDGTGTFTNGIVTALLPNVPMIFGPVGVPAGAQNVSHVNGVVRTLLPTGSFTYPVGNDTLYRKITANISSNPDGLDCQYFMADAGPNPFTINGTEPVALVAYFKREYWNMKRVTTTAATLTVYYDQVVPAVITSTTHLRVAHRTDTEWWNEGTAPGAVGTILAGSVTSNLLSTDAQWSPMTTTWSPITLGSINRLSPLPVTLVSFEGRRENNNDVLTWVTALEQNIKAYEVEYSTNAIQFEKLTAVAATGNGSNSAQNYQYIHGNVAGDAWYRLKITEWDGSSRYSRVIKISGTATLNTCLAGTGIYPVPFTNELNLGLYSCKEKPATITLYTAAGTKLKEERYTLKVGSAYYTLHNLDILPGGLYIIQIQTDTDLLIEKAIK